ncbi:MAG: RHS repeat-associated core domain-containing protein [Anaerolineae bacterium]|nr:RHS repeat-associated core domain-containing protein [Anaerolineae bacterium]
MDLPQLLTEFTLSEAEGATGARYLYGLERIGVQQDGAWSYPLSDALGSVRQWTNARGAGNDPQSYDPFGVPLPQPTTPASPFGYTGEWTDAATGLQYLRARWYDPATGRFTQVDPFPGVLSLPGTQQPYSYGLNNPLIYTDPSGEFVGAALASGLIGAAFAAAGYAFSHPGQGLECYLQDGDFWRAVGQGAASGLISGFLLGYFAPLPLLATGLGSAFCATKSRPTA